MSEVERFDIHLTPDKGRRLVAGSAIVGGALILFGLILSEPVLVLAALGAFAVALYNYPLLNRREGHLSATLHGLEIDGLGIVDWRSIKDLTLSEDAANPTILCTLQRTLEDSIMESDETIALRTIQVNIWRLQDSATLAIDISQVNEPAGEVISALKVFHKRARGGSQV